MADNSWKKPNRIENTYASQIQMLFGPLLDITKNLEKSEDIVSAIQSMLNSPSFHRHSEEVARKMVTNVYTDNAKNWRQAARSSAKSRLIYKELREEMEGPLQGTISDLIYRNAQIIRTLPRNISIDVVKYIQKRTTEGVRASDIAKEIQNMFPKKTRASAKLIARTEASKTQMAITQARAEYLGLYYYVWRTSKDQRVRGAHRHMEDVLCHYRHAPSPELLNKQKSEGYYNAGEIYNCRCYAEPLIDFEDIKWPHKVYNYRKKKIEVMTINKFKEFIA